MAALQNVCHVMGSGSGTFKQQIKANCYFLLIECTEKGQPDPVSHEGRGWDFKGTKAYASRYVEEEKLF